MLIFWPAFPSVLPGGGRALEISIVAGGGCFEWFPSVNQIPQNTRTIQGGGWGWGFFVCVDFFYQAQVAMPHCELMHAGRQGLGGRQSACPGLLWGHTDSGVPTTGHGALWAPLSAAAPVLGAGWCCRRGCNRLDFKAVERKGRISIDFRERSPATSPMPARKLPVI